MQVRIGDPALRGTTRGERRAAPTLRVPVDAGRPGPQTTYHTRTWLLWFLAAGLPALLTRNPLYLLLVMLAARGVDAAVAGYESAATPDAVDTRRQSWGGLLWLGVGLAAVSALFNGLGAHFGTTVLIRLPADWPIIGGPLTAEGFAYGALGGMSIVAVLTVAAAFNTGADTYALLRSIPAAFSQAGLVTAIGLAYVPRTITRIREIHEAQLLRGHRFRGARSVLPLAVPLLAGGLERAIQLAEAMESRGFSHPGPARPAPTGRAMGESDRLTGALLAIGAVAVALGAFALLYYRTAPVGGAIVLAGGLGAIGWALRRVGQASRRSRYRREIWRRRDTLVALTLGGALAVTLWSWATHSAWWGYTPYPTLHWPSFEPALGLALALLVAPALPLLRREARPLEEGSSR